MSNPANQPGSDQEWEEVLQQLRQQSNVQPQPFFYARVHARLAAQQQPRGIRLPSWARRPAYVALLGMLILAVSGDAAALHPATATNHYNMYQPDQPASLLPR